MEKEAVRYHPEMEAMHIGKEEPGIIVVPEEEPIYLPGEEPMQEPMPAEPDKEPAREPSEPVKEPEKIPAHVGAEGPQKVQGVKVGYRYGNVSSHTGDWKIHSPMYNLDWDRGPVEAKCPKGTGQACTACGGGGTTYGGSEDCMACGGTGKIQSHVSPPTNGDNCGCGLYAKWNVKDLNGEFGRDKWITKVHAWGSVHPAEIGFRAQHMQIQGIEPPYCTRCDKPATHLLAMPNAKGGLPVCEDHVADNIAGTPVQKHSITEIGQKLSNFYGVDVSPHGKMNYESEGAGYEKTTARTARDEGDIPAGYPKGFVPRVDEVGAKARKKDQLDRVDEEATKLQDKMKQFSGFRKEPDPTKNGFKETKTVKVRRIV